VTNTFTREDVELLRREVDVQGADRCVYESEFEEVRVLRRKIDALADRIEALVLADERGVPPYTPTTPDPVRLTLTEP
jgi:hypothetical protein